MSAAGVAPREVELSDGGKAWLRAIEPEDLAALEALHRGLSGESRYFRYFSFRKGLSERELDRMAHPDFVQHGGVVASIGGALVGHACFDRKEDAAEAEVAYEVADAHQGRGIATLLLEALADAARRAGVERFTARVLPHNRASLEVLRDLGFPERTRFEDGTLCVTLDITAVDAVRAAAARRARARRAPCGGEAEVEALPAGLTDDLASAAAHEGVPPEVVQTHISWVFLGAERVLKIRKAVRLGFLDFGTRAQRNEDCLREVRLNRRLAPDVYLGVAPILRGPAGWRAGPPGEELARSDGETPEHAVVMRRLPAGRDALSLLEAGALSPLHLDAVAAVLADFHARVGLGRPAPFTPEAWRDAVARPMAENLASLRETLAGARDVVEHTGKRFAAALERCGEQLEQRRRDGRAVEGHGDVHLQHVWFESGPETPLLVDCIEFSDGLRRIDAASEVAFLAMDLRYRGRRDLAERFLRRYAERSDDFDLYGVVELHAGYRAAVRAKVAGLAARDRSVAAAQRAAAEASASRHLTLAEELLAAPRPGPLVLLCGSVGSGKSTVAQALADRLGGAVVASDRVRKRLAGLPSEARAAAAAGEGIYTEEWNERTYAALLERAAPVVASGRPALLDASFAASRDRRRALRRARELGVEAWLVEVRCSEPVARRRLERRAREGRDPSDAGPELLGASLARFEPPAEWPSERRLVVESEDPALEARLDASARRIAGGAGES